MTTQKSLLEQIQQHQFAVHDLVLFLDTHPTDTAALEKHYELSEQLQKLIKVYHKEYQRHMTTHPIDSTVWEWVKSPWPWEKNFEED